MFRDSPPVPIPMKHPLKQAFLTEHRSPKRWERLLEEVPIRRFHPTGALSRKIDDTRAAWFDENWLAANLFFLDEILPEIITSLERSPNLVIEASPGAGKTTRVPPALLSLVSNEVLADLGNSYGYIEKMKPLPVDLRTLLHLVVASLLSLTPLLPTLMPLKDVLKLLLKFLA
jgi:hypothetical protein